MKTEHATIGTRVSFAENGQEYTGTVVSLAANNPNDYGQVTIGDIEPGIPGSESVTRSFTDLQGSEMTFEEKHVKYSGVAKSITGTGHVVLGDIKPAIPNRTTVTRSIVGGQVAFVDNDVKCIGTVESVMSAPANGMVIGDIQPPIAGRTTLLKSADSLTVANAAAQESLTSPMKGEQYKRSKPE